MLWLHKLQHKFAIESNVSNHLDFLGFVSARFQPRVVGLHGWRLVLTTEHERLNV